jgi:hypothetical protein
MPPSIPLPVPTSKEVEEFKSLYLSHHGIELTDDEALDAATQLIQYVWLTERVVRRLEKIKDRTKPPSSSVDARTALPVPPQRSAGPRWLDGLIRPSSRPRSGVRRRTGW